MLRIAVVMDPLESIQPEHDTTYLLMLEAARRGHQIHHVSPTGVLFRDGQTQLKARRIRPATVGAELFDILAPVTLTGADLDAVLIRTDPPFDDEYLCVTQLLDLLTPRPYIMNRPSGLRDANEKLAALHFSALIPPTLVTADPAEIDAFRHACGGSIVLKPLLGHGGEGVTLVTNHDPDPLGRIRHYTHDGTTRVVAQQPVAGAERGDKRIILLDGKPLGAMLRRNDSGGFVHNLAAGGQALPAKLDDQDHQICDQVGPWLRERGLDLAGIDILAGRLIEINVTSPTCVQEINRFDGVHLERAILDLIEDHASQLHSDL